ncbi:hypothetical protein PN36_33345 [Candidatus Thiomargarita nelsonii]|uniref:Uncharacterized protein n=1 Tax=Candidatus Thiomargarita nelsonii TaxID=1003181 RepID=A0A4E0QJX1_9GAMM|nr:hypothetical protein PN36_33345 [Candidatus Thiomargarita nelsonii]
MFFWFPRANTFQRNPIFLKNRIFWHLAPGIFKIIFFDWINQILGLKGSPNFREPIVISYLPQQEWLVGARVNKRRMRRNQKLVLSALLHEYSQQKSLPIHKQTQFRLINKNNKY